MAVAVPTVSAFTPVPTGAAAQQTAAQIGSTAQMTPAQMAAAQIGSTAQMTANTVDQSKLATPTVSTVQDQLTGILNKGGPLMQQAATFGSQQAAQRGLLNSSMGVQAAQAATLAQAVPIATSDANSTNQVALTNAGAVNQNLQNNANALNSAGQLNTNALNQTSQINTSAQNQAAATNAAAMNNASATNMAATNQTNQLNTSAQNQAGAANTSAQNQFALTNNQNANAAGQWNAGQKNEAIKQTMDLNSRESLANIEANYKQIMQVNSSAGTLYEQVMKNITDIQGNPDVADKAGAVQSQLTSLRSGLTMIQNLNGIQGLVTF